MEVGGLKALYQRDESGFGHGGGAAVLPRNGALAGAFDIPIRLVPDAETVADWRTRLADLDITVDLGARIGSREWLRGLVTCLALCAAPIACWPGFGPIHGASDPAMTPAHWEEARALAINPLGFGGDTGRRMAATDAVVPLADTPERPSIDLVATLGQGDGFARVLERAGVAKGQAQSISDMVSGAVSLGEIKPGTRMDVTLGRRASKSQPRPLDALAFRARFDLKLAVERVDGALALRRIPIAVDNTPLRIQGRVGSGLYLAARAAGAPAKAVESYIRAIGGRMSIGSDVRADDRFDLIIEHRRAETGEVETGQLLYAGLNQAKRKTSLLKWTSAGQTQWFEASGVGERRGGMTRPVIGRQTSGFGFRRHPILGYSKFHRGVDIGAAYGSPIVAVTDGVVNFSGWHGGHGNYVKLSHGNGMQTAYAHMSRIAARVGQRIAQGQVIGYVGSTGLSTGPHLHYEVFRNGAPINPGTIQFTSTAQIAGAELARFRSTLAKLLAVKPGAAATTRTAEAPEKVKPAKS